jgi:uracil-DNA glycosylase
MNVRIEPGWKSKLQAEFEKEYFVKLSDYIREEYKAHTVYPPGSLIFNAFDLCSFNNVKAVIIGQDPYHGPGQAHGLCFSVREGVASPPSLLNIFKEIEMDLGLKKPVNGNLERWASQGVLLLNATLTVKDGVPGSHQKKGWEQFTDSVINILNNEKQNLVYFLWGSFARNKCEPIDRSKNLILESVHPSPLSASRGFFGNKHFSRCNNYLTEKGIEPIKW